MAGRSGLTRVTIEAGRLRGPSRCAVAPSLAGRRRSRNDPGASTAALEAPVIPVQLTCESEDIAVEEREADGLRYRPVIRLNGEPVWRGKPERSAADAERVALSYLRYSLSGVMSDPTAGDVRMPPPGEPQGEPHGGRPSAAVLGEAVELLGTEVLGALKKVSDFLESGDWKRFLR